MNKQAQVTQNTCDIGKSALVYYNLNSKLAKTSRELMWYSRDTKLFAAPLKNNMKKFSLICQCLGYDAESAFEELGRGIIDQIKSGDYALDNKRTLSRNDIPKMKDFLTKVRNGNISFMHTNKNKRISGVKSPRIGNEFEPYFVVGSDTSRLGKWLEAPAIPYKATLHPGFYQAVMVPILPGKETVVEIKSAEEEVPITFFSFDKIVDPVLYPPFQAQNPIFTLENFAGFRNGVYTFKSNYVNPSSCDLATLTERYASGISGKILVLALMEAAGIRRATFDPALRNLKKFLAEKSTGEEIDIADAYDLKYLVGSLRMYGLYPGDCKSVASMAVALANSFDFTARMLAGVVTLLEKNKIVDIGLHAWAEVLHPKKKIWVPLDPTVGDERVSSKDYSYMVWDHVPMEIYPFKVRVTCV